MPLPRFALIQCRNQDDPVRAEEITCFSTRLGVPETQLQLIDLLRDPLDGRALEGVDALLVGGSGDYSVLDPVPEIARFIRFLTETALSGFPTFASCFGFQALVLGLGGRVVHDEANAEVGSYALTTLPAASGDPLFSDFPSEFMAQLGHKDRADALPDCAIPLARSARVAFQAFRLAGKPTYATQFHPEMTWLDNRRRLQRYMAKYGLGLFGAEEAQRRLDSHVPSPEANALLPRFVATFVTATGR